MVVWSEDVAVEIEALQATYADNLVIDEEQQQVSMCIQPQQEQQQNYVQCQLLLTTPPDYPSEQPPAIQLQDVKGFVNRQDQLQQLLVAEAVELTGELLLGHLFEAAKAWLTEQDQPEGPCIFCLEDLAAAADSSTSTMRLPCFHAYHESCFAEWWCWQQGAYLQQQKALEEQTGATAAAALVREALPPKDGPHFRLSCPICRAPFQLQDLPGATQQQLQQQQAQGAKQQQQQQQQHPAMAKLTAAQLQPFLQLQQRHAQLFARQQQRQGIIDTDVSICIADWEGPSTSSASSSSTSTVAAGGAGGSTAGGGGAGRGAHHARGGVLPAGRGGRGSSSSSSSSGRGSRGGSRGGRGNGRHIVRLSDGADPGWQQGHPQARQPQQQVRQQHGQQQHLRGQQQQHPQQQQQQQQQQCGQQEERDWLPREHPSGSSLQQRAVEGEKLQQPERAPAGARGSRGSRGRGPRAGRGAGRQACG